jgi:release factor glutamine methyltransferase
LQALASGADGLDDIRQIITQARAHLCLGGWLLLEHGYDQAEPVRDLLLAAGFEQVQSRRDLNGIDRCSGGRLVSVLQNHALAPDSGHNPSSPCTSAP